MTVLAVALTAAAPVMRQQARRERELEAIRRGEEVAEAIYRFMKTSGQPPTSMDQLIEGANRQGSTRKVQVLRSWAARDPLTEDGEWRLIRGTATNSALCDFYATLVKYNNGAPVEAQDEYKPFVQRCGAGTVTGLSGSGGSEIGDGGTGPIIGVASRSREKSIVTYYGIDQPDEWIFTPALPKR